MPSIVLDPGTGMMKAGFCGDDAPRAVIPSVVGSPEDGGDDKFVGEEAQAKRDILALKNPIEQGVITDWDTMEKLLDHTFYSGLRVAPEEAALVFTEPTPTAKADREKILEVMFEKFRCPAVYANAAAVFGLYAAGRTTGLAVDAGAGQTVAVPVYDGVIEPHAVEKFNMAGNDLTDYLMKILGERDYSFSTDAERQIVSEMKEKLCYMAEDFEQEMQTAANGNTLDKTYELPDGKVVTLGNERFRCPEAIFLPGLMGKEGCGLPEAVYQSVLKNTVDLRASFFSNIVLTGGNTMFTGMQERFQKAISALAPPTAVVKVLAPPERKFSNWIGGSIVGSLDSFKTIWISQQEYQAEGAAIVHRMKTV